MDEVKRILTMIEQGKITANEGMELLKALQATKNPVFEELDEAKDEDFSKDLEETQESTKAQVENEKKDDEEDHKKPVNLKVKKKYKLLRFRIDVEKEDIHINMAVPLALMSAVSNLQKMIPPEAKKHMQENGVDIEELNLKELMEGLRKGEIEDPYITRMHLEDPSNGKVTIEIFLD